MQSATYIIFIGNVAKINWYKILQQRLNSLHKWVLAFFKRLSDVNTTLMIENANKTHAWIHFSHIPLASIMCEHASVHQPYPAWSSRILQSQHGSNESEFNLITWEINCIKRPSLIIVNRCLHNLTPVINLGFLHVLLAHDNVFLVVVQPYVIKFTSTGQQRSKPVIVRAFCRTSSSFRINALPVPMPTSSTCEDSTR
jgi:hypothetical protein